MEKDSLKDVVGTPVSAGLATNTLEEDGEASDPELEELLDSMCIQRQQNFSFIFIISIFLLCRVVGRVW